jgi:hypothetical protein
VKLSNSETPYLAAVAVSAVESAVVGAELSALGAALYRIGMPKDSMIRYEAAVEADGFLVMAHGTAAEMARAKPILGTASPSRLDLHQGTKMAEPAEDRVPQAAERFLKMDGGVTNGGYREDACCLDLNWITPADRRTARRCRRPVDHPA